MLRNFVDRLASDVLPTPTHNLGTCRILNDSPLRKPKTSALILVVFSRLIFRIVFVRPSEHPHPRPEVRRWLTVLQFEECILALAQILAGAPRAPSSQLRTITG